MKCKWIAMIAVAGMFMFGCEDSGSTANDAAEKVEQAADEAANATEDAMEEAGEMAEDAMDKADSTMNEMAEDVEEAVEGNN